MNVDFDLRVVPLHLDLGDASGVELVLQVLADVIVLHNQVAHLIGTGIPARVPVLDHANAQSMGINFLSHSYLLLKPSRSHQW